MPISKPQRFYQSFDLESWEPSTIAANEYRDAFKINRDRILHSSAFRSLQSKTQVFFSGAYDFYRTRLTHSLEVAQIGRGICDWLAHSSDVIEDGFELSSDLVEAACLSHDLGHPPFGHTGERVLNERMREFGGFEGNAQTLRLLTQTLFSKGTRGMNPTRAFMDSVLKYKTLKSELENPKHHFLYDAQHVCLDFVYGGRDFPLEYIPGKVRDSFRSIECQIMDWSDDVAYSIHDLSDAIKGGFITIQSIESWAESKELNDDHERLLMWLMDGIREDKMEARFGRKIGEYIQACSLVDDANFMSGVTNRHRYRLKIQDEARFESVFFKQIAFEMVFRHPKLQQVDYKAERILGRLFDALMETYLDVPVGKTPRLELLDAPLSQRLIHTEGRSERARWMCDYLADMTDGTAVRLYRRLYDPSFGSILEFV